MNNLTQFGTLLSAFGCRLDYNSQKTRLEVTDSPDPNLIDRVIDDVSKFDDTANYSDGAAAICLADTIDGALNPLNKSVRMNVLHGLGLMNEERFIYQVLSLQKNNRSWHGSEIPYACSYFGEICTHRGVKPDPNRKGRTSNREPEDYHTLKANDTVNREQLVTPSIEEMWKNTPEDNLISGRTFVTISDVNIKKLKNLNLEDRLRVIRELEIA